MLKSVAKFNQLQKMRVFTEVFGLSRKCNIKNSLTMSPKSKSSYRLMSGTTAAGGRQLTVTILESHTEHTYMKHICHHICINTCQHIYHIYTTYMQRIYAAHIWSIYDIHIGIYVPYMTYKLNI